MKHFKINKQQTRVTSSERPTKSAGQIRIRTQGLDGYFNYCEVLALDYGLFDFNSSNVDSLDVRRDSLQSAIRQLATFKRLKTYFIQNLLYERKIKNLTINFC